MSLCRTISILAAEAEAQMFDLSESQKGMLEVLKDAPQYLAKGNLAEWDADYHRSISDDDDETERNFRVIDSIYELAAINLYGAYQADETRRLYDSIVLELHKLGVSVSPDLSVAAW